MVLCYYSGSSGGAQQMTNGFQVAPTALVAGNLTVNLYNISTTVANNWISCTFSRLVSDSSISGYFNLNNQYYILAAVGAYSASTPQYHGARSYSSSTVNFSQISTSSSSSSTTQAIKAHGTVLQIII